MKRGNAADADVTGGDDDVTMSSLWKTAAHNAFLPASDSEDSIRPRRTCQRVSSAEGIAAPAGVGGRAPAEEEDKRCSGSPSSAAGGERRLSGRGRGRELASGWAWANGARPRVPIQGGDHDRGPVAARRLAARLSQLDKKRFAEDEESCEAALASERQQQRAEDPTVLPLPDSHDVRAGWHDFSTYEDHKNLFEEGFEPVPWLQDFQEGVHSMPAMQHHSMRRTASYTEEETPAQSDFAMAMMPQREATPESTPPTLVHNTPRAFNLLKHLKARLARKEFV